MKKVDDIYPFGINTTIGPTGTIKRLFKNREFFLERGYELSIFAIQRAQSNQGSSKVELSEIVKLPSIGGTAVGSAKNNWKSLLQSRKHAFVESNYFTSAWSYKRANRINEEDIKHYLSLDRTPDVVVFHDMRSCYNYLKNVKEKTAKVVMFVHGDGSDLDMFCKRKPKLKDTNIVRDLKDELMFTYEKCDCIVWISELAKIRFCKNHPEYAHKAVAVVNGIDDMIRENAPVISDYKYRLVTTGTVCERKGQYIIVEAMRKMKPEVLKDTHLTIIGTGPDHAKLQGLSKQYGLKEHISFLGNVPNAEVHRLLCAENIFILMSNNEGLPISILEAMRAGLPVISTQVAGIPEEVDDRNGFLLNPDIEQLTDLLNRLPEYDWTSKGQASRSRFENEFTFDIMRRKFADMFDSLFNC